jgi:hypothetical protein
MSHGVPKLPSVVAVLLPGSHWGRRVLGCPVGVVALNNRVVSTATRRPLTELYCYEPWRAQTAVGAGCTAPRLTLGPPGAGLLSGCRITL